MVKISDVGNCNQLQVFAVFCFTLWIIAYLYAWISTGRIKKIRHNRRRILIKKYINKHLSRFPEMLNYAMYLWYMDVITRSVFQYIF